MLRVTEEAATLLREVREQVDSSPQGGARLVPEPSPQGMGIRIGFVQEPEGSDQVIEQSGMRVFVADELTEPLADKTLDTQATPEGTQLLLRDEGS